MNILLINVPSRKGAHTCTLPFGLLYVASIIEKCGYKVRIIDPYIGDKDLQRFDSGDFSRIYEVIGEFKPEIIGFGGIATSYGRVKKLALTIRQKYPGIIQIAGGVLSSVGDLLLTNAKIDFVFHGETELSLSAFLQNFRTKQSMDNVPGMSFILQDKILKTQAAAQINDIDSIGLPAYHLVDIKQYLEPIQPWIEANQQLFNTYPQMRSVLKSIGERKYYFPIVTARGCTHKCSFCYRHMQGIRQHSTQYVVNHIKFLKASYGIEGFNFSDELFNSRPEWVFELCDLMEKEKINIFYIIAGARVDRMNEKMLRRLKETGCIQITYGQESGSDKILQEYKKGVTSMQNKEMTLLTSHMGITCPMQIVIGSPGENNETIRQTIRFLKESNAFRLSWNYLIPLPGTPIWQYVRENRLIDDVEKYLDLVADSGGGPLVNLTRVQDRVWRNWSLLIRKEINLYYYRKTNFRRYLYYRLLYCLADAVFLFIPQAIRKGIPKNLKSWCWKLEV